MDAITRAPYEAPPTLATPEHEARRFSRSGTSERFTALRKSHDFPILVTQLKPDFSTG
jgi:hypothetical protein